jgi:hypothetical protein
MSDIKSINITGDAVRDISPNQPKKGGRRSTRKSLQTGGDIESLRGVSQNIIAIKGTESVSNMSSTAASVNSNTWLKYPANSPVPPQIKIDNISQPILQPPSTLQQEGGTKHIKVELKGKEKSKKVHLNPKKGDVPRHSLSKKHHTRKIRKVVLGLSNLKKRITRANRLHKEVKDMPIDKLRDKLVKGGFIKENSKAPESVLRQIAADAAVVKNKAL